MRGCRWSKMREELRMPDYEIRDNVIQEIPGAHVVIEQKPALEAFLEDTMKLRGMDASKARLAEGFELRNGEIWAHYDTIRLTGAADGPILIEYVLGERTLHQEMGPPGTGFGGALEITFVDGWVKLDLGVMGG